MSKTGGGKRTADIDNVESLLEKTGFKGLAENLKVAKDAKRKLAVAYEHFRYVTQKKVDEFNAKLKVQTMTGTPPFSAEWSKLSFTPIETYDKVPPVEALLKLEEAQGMKCFDSYEVAYIEKVKDPIIFGRIQDCPDRFFIAQWDTDCSIQDILKDNEG